MDLCKLALLLGALTCTASGTEVDRYTKIEGAQIRSLQRRHYSVNTVAECAAKCDAETSFTCRSFTYNERDDECWTAPDNSKTLMVERGKRTVLYEKKKEYIPECRDGAGIYYRGTKSKTKSGKTCQSWAAKSPHAPDFTPQEYPQAGLESNFCRNPNGDSEGPWCYTTDPDTRWEYCDVATCTDECMHCNGEDYRGKISITENNYTCQRWDSQEPHSHDYDPKTYYNGGLDENFCRNSDGAPRPWCFTTDPSKRWDYCTIPRCISEPPAIVPELTCVTGNGEDYRGTIAVTKSGKTCQSWSALPLQQHNYLNSYPCKGLDENYCRNPDNQKMPWCYTTDIVREYCDVPSCGDTDEPMTHPEEEDCYEGDGSSYRGVTSETVSGKKCQDWSAMTPHNHSYTPQNYPKADLRMNLCRSPDGNEAPWCYTTDPRVRWEYCNLEQCPTNSSGGTPTATPNPQTPSSVTPPQKDCKTGNGETYQGPTSTTIKGVTCQAWSAQSPHQHKNFTPETHPDKGLDGNSCRNPDNDVSGLWCYTTDNNTRWDYCHIPNCVSLCGTPVFKPKRCFDRIVGGCVANPHSWPWQINLQTTRGFHRCGGSLIHPQWVFTAKHCLHNCEDPAYYKVLLGVHTKSGNEPSRQERNVEEVICEPNGADIALLKLQSPAIINNKVLPVCLPEKDYIVPTRAKCYVTGWGATRSTDDFVDTGGAGVLKQTGLTVIQDNICNGPSYLNGLLKDHEMCAGISEGGKDTCQGDSGGPLVCNSQNSYILQGVTSRGYGCATPMSPGIYVRVSKFVDWINKMIEDN